MIFISAIWRGKATRGCVGAALSRSQGIRAGETGAKAHLPAGRVGLGAEKLFKLVLQLVSHDRAVRPNVTAACGVSGGQA